MSLDLDKSLFETRTEIISMHPVYYIQKKVVDQSKHWLM